MQSLSRAIRRGQAYIYFDNVTKTIEVMRKRGTNRKVFRAFKKNRLTGYEQGYCESVKAYCKTKTGFRRLNVGRCCP